ncbi:hypothetical protein Sjap_021236 [Stephania japonica]|uniref:HhH-GPD domain-containing protein n=1 Tax=Stephania japonica TaxID=461633 RepID=A0AAP0EVH0_9MAGN
MGREEGEWECVASIAVPGSFDLEKAVCSHGLFMMAPNRWDPSTRALMRPLRLSDSSLSVMSRISSSSSSSSSCLNLQVLNATLPPPRRRISPQDRGWLQSQVERMLRLSDAEERNLKEFHRIHPEAKARGFARVFRSPTLFEDMVKCILLCNCQWPRTLTMAKALCQFQLDLKSATSKTNEDFLLVVPSTPAATREPTTTTTTTSRRRKRSSPPKLNHTTTTTTTTDTDHQPPMPSTSDHETIGIGDFPTPEELANIDPNVLGRRCNLGYRAPRIVKLAQSITRGEFQLQQLQQQEEEEEALLHGPSSTLVYDRLAKQLMKIDGFGPFTCANVLVCMGFYQVIPIDTETIRHIKTVHAPSCTTKTVQNDVHKVYAKYAPFQFLAYWSELWEFYEKWFGKTSDMPSSSYHLITASNMKASKHKKTNNHI